MARTPSPAKDRLAKRKKELPGKKGNSKKEATKRIKTLQKNIKKRGLR